LIKRFLSLGCLLATVSLLGSCSGEIDGAQGGARDFSAPDDGFSGPGNGSSVPNAPGSSNDPLNPGGLALPTSGTVPNAANTGITEAWCPDWAARKTNTSGRTITTDGAVIEYEEINGTLHIDAKNVTVRCVKVHASDTLWGVECSDNGNSSTRCTEGFLLEDAEVYGDEPGLSLAALGLVVSKASVRRVHMYGGCDGMKVDGGMVRDSFVEDRYRCPSPDPHHDGWQSGSSSGPVWMLNNAIEGPFGGQTSAIILKGDSGAIEDYTIHGNTLSGGNYTFYMRAPNTPNNMRITSNTFILDSWNLDIEGSAGDAFSNDSDGPGQCIEYSGNVFEDGTPITPGSRGAPSNVQQVGACSGISPIPTWSVESLALSSTECGQGQASCDGIALTAQALGSQTGGEPRWRYHCGRQGDLWEKPAGCDGQTSCTVTDACDYSGGAAGTYTVRIYSESGPGSGVRVSDAASASFVVSN